MKAGQTNINVGTKVTIINQIGDDSILNGLTGTITHPFGFGETGKNWVGVWLDKKGVLVGDNCSVRVSEIKILCCQ